MNLCAYRSRSSSWFERPGDNLILDSGLACRPAFVLRAARWRRPLGRCLPRSIPAGSRRDERRSALWLELGHPRFERLVDRFLKAQSLAGGQGFEAALLGFGKPNAKHCCTFCMFC